TGAVSGVAGTTAIGGMVGAVAGADDTITNGYWDTLTSGLATSAGGQGATTAQLQGGAALPFSAAFAGGAAGGGTDVYPYLIGFFPNGVQAISGFAFQNAASSTPLVSNPNGATTVYGDFSHFTVNNNLDLVANPSTTGANGYYYIFTDSANLPAGR